MPIKGVSDKRRLPREGCIRLGLKVPLEGGASRPKEVDYFILDPATTDDEERAEYLSQFNSLFGEKPKTIDIMFPVDDENVFFPQFYKRYGSSTDLKCFGDGETAVCMEEKFAKGLKVIGKTQRDKLQVECKGDKCIYIDTKKPECGMVGSLLVLIPKISMSGVWQITTRSYNSIVNINSSLALARNVGRIHMVPAKLQRRPQKTKYQGKVATHYILHLTIDNSQSQAQIPTHAGDLVMPEADASVEAVAIRGEEVDETATAITKEDAKEYKKNTEAYEASIEDKSQESFVEGLKKDNKEEYGEPGKYVLPAEAKELTFWEFMPKARAKLKKAGAEKAYIDTLHTYSVQVLSDLKDDEKRQGEVRELIEAEMEDRGVKW